MSNRLVKIIATFFYVGYLPLIPGTFGSVAALLLFLILPELMALVIGNQTIAFWLMVLALGNQTIAFWLIVQCAFLAVFMFLGFYFSGKAEKLFNSKDPKYIVIDEVGGMFLTFLFVPLDFRLLLIGFLLFRVLDIVKPYPADKLQNFPGSAGIMLDDIVAGIYANVILQVLSRVILRIPA